MVVGRWWTSGSLAIISKRVGLDRVLSGGGDIGFKRPAVRAELNLEKLEGKDSLESIIGEKRIL